LEFFTFSFSDNNFENKINLKKKALDNVPPRITYRLTLEGSYEKTGAVLQSEIVFPEKNIHIIVKLIHSSPRLKIKSNELLRQLNII